MEGMAGSASADGNKEKRESLYSRYMAKCAPGWRCLSCPQKFLRKDSLRDHVEAVHLINIRFYCPYDCSYMGRTRKTLRNHVNSHHRAEQAEKQLDWDLVNFVILSGD